ncbi:S-formylglutathione hydrolase [Tetranychus urticae]|uniref:S-formylglutathione hydrolase n=1 Tax=Tetranychus urticae TaxID=32264 RepID=UPI00077BFEB0|nr:S-formylglutathione hydrolase [Tetranychus urticae]
MAGVKIVSTSKCFGGHQFVYSHKSSELKCEMKFSLYIPPGASETNKLPVLYWLSGLTCTEQNFIIKSGFQRYAAEHNLVVVGPDTSPRECGVEGEDDDWKLGTGAGFYVDATQGKWVKNYRMYSYVTKELIKVVEDNFKFVLPGVRSISGHSMGGHGALICALKNPGLYKSCSAFAPIANPMSTPVGKACLEEYLGPDTEAWKDWDASQLVAKYNGPPLHLIVEQGSEDEFALLGEIMIEKLTDACKAASLPVDYRLRDGYDHGYFFVSTFIGEHIKHHTTILKS